MLPVTELGAVWFSGSAAGGVSRLVLNEGEKEDAVEEVDESEDVESAR